MLRHGDNNTVPTECQLKPGGAEMEQSKRRAREIKEIARLEREQTRQKPHWYLAYLLIVISIVYIADEITTQIGGQMQTELARSLFAPIYGDGNAVAKMSLFEIWTYIGVILGFWYRPLADRYGRRPFLILNTLGMGLGAFVVGLASGIPVFVIGSCILSFFTPYDMQVVYITETAPEKHRAKYYSITKAVATFGMLLIPVFRSAFMGNDTSKWHNVYFAAAVVAFIGGMLALIFSRETDAFITSRLNYLKKTDEERERDRNEKDAKDAQGGFIAACKLCRRHKQIWFSIIAYGLIYCGITMTTYYTVTMTYGYAKIFTAQGYDLASAKDMTAQMITTALMAFPIASAFFQLIQGFISDKIGRKSTAAGMAILSVAAYILFFVGTEVMWHPLLVGALCGTAVGALWSSGDNMNMILMESTPTNLRASVSTVQTLGGAIFTAAQAVQLVCINIFGDAQAGLISVLVAVPPMMAGIIILLTKIRETKGTDISNVKLEED